jgi:vacuolar-type H+-ATPase subunit B/Vma2
MNRPIQETLDAQWALLKDLFESMGAEYPNP